MSVQEEVFEDFVKKIEERKIPADVLVRLRKLWENNELESTENILEVLKVIGHVASNPGY